MAGRLNFMPPLSSLNFERADNGDAAFMALSVSFRDTFKIESFGIFLGGKIYDKSLSICH